jgi:hypothetical protein
MRTVKCCLANPLLNFPRLKFGKNNNFITATKIIAVGNYRRKWVL